MSLSLAGVTKTVGGQDHIRDVSVTLQRGSLNVLLGPTLSGKTSLMRLMAGLDRPTHGRIEVDGRNVIGLPLQKRNVAMVYQQFINYPSLSVFENIASPLRVAGVPRGEIQQRVAEAAKLLRLDGLLDRTPLQLSGGQQQRTALARALVKRAELVLLDEPLANLDYKLREELREELPRIFADTGAILVYATTEPAEALLLGGNTGVMHEGRMTQFGPTLEVYRRPADRATATVFPPPPMNFVTVLKEGATLRLSTGQRLDCSGHLQRLKDGPVELGFRPNHLSLRPGAPALSRIRARVAVVELSGSESFVHLQHGDDAWVALAHGIHNPPSGSEIDVFLDTARTFAFGEAGELRSAPEEA